MSSFVYGKATNVDVKIFSKTSTLADHPTVSISQEEIEANYTIIGGGAVDNWEGSGNLLTASAPVLDDNKQVIGWMASGKDHFLSDPATVTVFAIAMKVIRTDGSAVNIQTKCFSKESEKTDHPTVSISQTDIDPGYIIIGGGAVDNWEGVGNMLTASAPILDDHKRVIGWTASGKDHSVSDPATVTVYAVGMYLEGENFNFDIKAKSVISEKADHPTCMIKAERVIGGGAVDNWEGFGSLLTQSAPLLDTTKARAIGWIGSGKDQQVSDPATVTVYVLELSPFNVVYNKVVSSPNWVNQIDSLKNVTIDEAQNHALADDRITYFFRVRDGKTIDLGDHGVFNSGDAVFFSQQPTYSDAEGVVDMYQKSAPNLISTSVSSESGFIYLKASMIVPKVDGKRGTIFLWPGFQSSTFSGVLQPVLTFGPSCAPNPGNIPSEPWWISGLYVSSGYMEKKHLNDLEEGVSDLDLVGGCQGGSRLALKAGDLLTVTMEYDEKQNLWIQTCESNGQSVNFSISLGIATQCIFANENPGQPSGVYEGSYMDDSFSLFDVVVKTKASFEGLASDLLPKLNVIGLTIDADNQMFTIDRVVIYSPIAR